MSKVGGFDFIAPYYDRLAHLAFGNAIKDSQLIYLDRIPKASRILVIGGGTGIFLYALHQHAPDAHVVYVDASARMLEIAKKNTPPGLRVDFVHGRLEDMPRGQAFDVVVTYFFLDMFSTVDLQNLISNIAEVVAPDSMWLVADFVKRKWWHGLLLACMYAFFSAFAGLRVRSLADWNAQLARAGFRRAESRCFFSGFIESAIFKDEIK